MTRKKTKHTSKVITLKGIDLIFVPGKSFKMGFSGGEDEERPEHDVELDSFYMSKFPITFKQYDVYCKATNRNKPDDEGWGRGSRPVINVNWYDAVKYCKWISEKTGENIRIPTEAEWEFAARDCGKRMHWVGTKNRKKLHNYMWFEENSFGTSHPVGEKKPNGLGLYDMIGNVSVWCNDWYAKDYYSNSPIKNPEGPTAGAKRVIRGGSWLTYGGHDGAYGLNALRTTSRRYSDPKYKANVIGFRVVKLI